MATTEHNPLAGIERRRAELEENVSKLQKALRHWQTLEMEYEMFKEEIQFADFPSRSGMIEIATNLGFRLLDDKEVRELVGNDKNERTANQVVDMISRRIDYVQQNITGAAKQLDAAEKKIAGASVLLEPEVENEEGLPLMDIQEELDGEGNVVSSSLVQPGKAAPEIVAALKEAGVHKLEKDESNAPSLTEDDSASSTQSVRSADEKYDETRPKKAAESVPGPSPSATELPERPKKSVTFSEDTRPDPELSNGRSALEKHGYNEDLANYTFPKGTKVIEVDADDNEIAAYPVMPEGESEEDAELRRQMIQYGLTEVGAIVAEMDLDGRDSGASDEDMDDYNDYDDGYDTEESEAEDKYGRSLKREVSDDYRKQMLELEKKLNARMVENVGPRPEGHLAEYTNDLRTLKIQKDESLSSEEKPPETPADPSSKKKGVRFAEELDISPASHPIAPAIEPKPPAKTSTSTISDTIVERAGPAPQPPSTAPSKPAKVSRFKSARAASASEAKVLPLPAMPPMPPVPTGPKGQTLANTIVEHDISQDEPHVPDEFDPVVINREIQTQYHKMRNKMIQQQGGFKPTEEDEDNPLVEQVDGKEKKVSRFRAARLKQEGL